MKEFTELQAVVGSLVGAVDNVSTRVAALEQGLTERLVDPVEVKAVSDAVNAQVGRLNEVASGLISIVGVGLSGG